MAKTDINPDPEWEALCAKAQWAVFKRTKEGKRFIRNMLELAEEWRWLNGKTKRQPKTRLSRRERRH